MSIYQLFCFEHTALIEEEEEENYPPQKAI